jgi:KDO2-lipid IV(A) lauroyltransferase
MKADKKVKFKSRVEYLVFIIVVFSFKLLPFSFIKPEAFFLRMIFRLTSRRHSEIVDKNLNIAFPEKNSRELAKLKRDIYHFFSEMFVYNINVFAKKRMNNLIDRVEVKNLEIVKECLQKGEGVILFSAHFGNWEMIPYILNQKLGRHLYSIARNMDNPLIEDKVMDFREFMGSKILYKKGSLRRVLSLLKENRIVYLLTDQNTLKRDCVYVDFFGKRVSAIPTVSKLHVKKGVNIVPAFLYHRQDKLTLEIMQPIQYEDSADPDKTIRELTQESMKLFEEKIREYPSQWFWFHNRWKNAV